MANERTVSRAAMAPLSIAPMMDRTDRFYRAMMRLITAKTVLYSEMRTTGAILHGDKSAQLGMSRDQEGIVSLQLGGDDPDDLARCCELAQQWGYAAVNLNVGCPSERVQRGRIGAILMRDAKTVAQCVAAMIRASDLPVSVKHRIGVDQDADYEFMRGFVDTVAQAGCEHFIVHARAAWLNGLNPKQNRTIPPLCYESVYRLKAEYPALFVEINGGIQDLEEARAHLQYVDGVMIGRRAWDHPFLFADADEQIFGGPATTMTRRQVVAHMGEILPPFLGGHMSATFLLRGLLGLYAGMPGTKRWKQGVAAIAARADAETLGPALEALADEVQARANSHALDA